MYPFTYQAWIGLKTVYMNNVSVGSYLFTM